jgi:competence protein ComGC
MHSLKQSNSRLSSNQPFTVASVQQRAALTLVEIVLALVILTVAAVVTMAYVRQPAERVKRESCNLRIQQLETLVLQYIADYGHQPSSNLSQLVSPRYLGETLPVCPLDGRAYLLDTRTGNIVPHSH